ncbi:mRNA-capping enzyme subunit alpha [Trichomonascus vanleenenianus]|uniref:mRNA guanylyltransferase n=1 Tax=Trichomonascus vanleenenianus TaxID=2268995 RepID=UPI003ECA9B82
MNETRTVPTMPGTQVPPQSVRPLQAAMARLLQQRHTGFPGSQPVSFARKHISERLLREDYYVCEKSDGIRCLMYLADDPACGEAVYLVTRKNEYFFVPQLHFPTTESQQEYYRHGTVIDGELVISREEDGSEQLKYLMFDCLCFNGKLITDRSLDKRLGHLRTFIYGPYHRLCQDFPEDVKMFPFVTDFKDMRGAADLAVVITEVLPKLKHVSDGVIFTPRWTPYVYGTDERLLKWKPPEENTVDFRLELEFPPYTDPDLPPGDPDATYTNYDDVPHCRLLVWTGGSNDRYYDDLHLEEDEWEKLKALREPLNRRIVESYQDDHQRWRYMRFRDDKPNGNHTSTVEKVIESIRDAVTLDELLQEAPRIREAWDRRRMDRKRSAAQAAQATPVDTLPDAKRAKH